MRNHNEHRKVAASTRASIAGMTDRKSPKDRQFVTALARGLAILNCFSAEQPERTGSDIARLTGLPQPTVWRLCHTMITMGVLVETPGDRMRPGLAALRLGSSALAGLDTVDLARPAMQAIADDYRAACGLAVRQGLQMVMIERCHGNNPLLTNLRRGSAVPMARSGHGWAYLAALPAAARQSLIAEIRTTDPSDWTVARSAFRRALDAYPADGYIVNSGIFHPDYHTAAVPVHDRDRNIRFTLNCGGPLSTLSPRQLRDEVAPRLKRLAEELEAAIAMESGRRAG